MLNLIKKRKSDKKGMTLMELIIVMAIIGILATIGITQFKQMTNSAKETVDVAMASEIASATKLYVVKENIEVLGGTDVDVTVEDLIAKDYIDPSDIKIQSAKYLNGTNVYGKDAIEITIAVDGSTYTVDFNGVTAYPES